MKVPGLKDNKFILKQDGWVVLLLIAIHISCWFGMKPIAPQGDPLCYFLNAMKILNHQYAITGSVQDQRFGVFVPQAILIGLFGENPYVINLWVLLCSIFTMVLVYFFALKNVNRGVAFAAGLLLSVNLIQVIYSTVVFPDIIVSFFSFCCVCLLYKGRAEIHYWKRNSFLFILFFAGGFFAKESILLMLPFTGFIFWRDFRLKKFFTFHKSVLILLLFFALTLLSASKLLTHDYLFLYKSYAHYQLYAPFTDMASFLKRISYEPLMWFNSQPGYVFLLVFAIPSVVSGLQKKDNYSSAESFIALHFVILLAVFWWGSISLTHFGAVPITDRRWMMLITPLCILSAITVYKITLNETAKSIFYFFTITLTLLSIINGIFFSTQRGILFLGFALMILIEKIIAEKTSYSIIHRILVLIIPFILLAFYFIINNSNYVVWNVR